MRKISLKYFLIFILLLVIFIFCNTGSIFCDNTDTGTEKISGSSNAGIMFDYNLNTSNFDKDIYTIIITSIIVIGVLVFAVWKTINSKKQY